MLETPDVALIYFIWFLAAFALAAILLKINS